MDVETGLVLNQCISTELEADEYFDYFDDVLDEQLYCVEPAKHRLDHYPKPGDQRNIAIFTAGWGDGLYPTYCGLDGLGELVAIVTDFQTFEMFD